MKRLRQGCTALLGAVAVTLAWAGSYEDFFHAIALDNSRAVESLVERGFDPNTLDPKGQTGLFKAVAASSWKSVQVLINAPKIEVETRNAVDESPLMLTAIQGEIDIAKALIAKGADVNKTGWTPLHYAASKPNVDMSPMITLLLDNHAYVDAESPNGSTPLMMAARYGTDFAVNTLLTAGADPTLKNEQGLTALDFATQAGNDKVAKTIADAILTVNHIKN
jgi:uncharacterized protein